MNSDRMDIAEAYGRLLGLIDFLKTRSQFRHIDHASDIQNAALRAAEIDRAVQIKSAEILHQCNPQK